jgi:hypothetical protein
VLDARHQCVGREGHAHRDQGSLAAADITQAMARQMKAERERRAQILEAEGDKAAAITARRRRQAGRDPGSRRPPRSRLSATPRRANVRPKPKPKRDGRRVEAIAKGDVNAINYFLGQKYVEAFGQLATSNQQRTVIVPADLSGPLLAWSKGLRALNAQGRSGSAGGLALHAYVRAAHASVGPISPRVYARRLSLH